mgnify:CR=1 FL=1
MAESNKMKGSQEHIYRCNEGDFFKFLCHLCLSACRCLVLTAIPEQIRAATT